MMRAYSMLINWLVGLCLGIGLALPAGMGQVVFPQDTFAQSSPVLSSDGNRLYFSRLQHPANVGLTDLPDVWVSTWADGWQQPVHIPPPFNGFGADQVVSVGLGERFIWLLREEVSGSFLERLRLHGRSWEVDQRATLGFVPDSIRHITDWHISTDERLLFFCGAKSTDSPADIYLSRRGINDQWLPAERLPSPINSPRHESSVFLAADGLRLYYSSDRPGGNGRQDLYMVTARSSSLDRWQIPFNLGPDVNGAGNDEHLYVSVANQRAIYVSDRTGPPQLRFAALPDLAKPDDVRLVRCSLDLSAAVDSARLVYFPIDQPSFQRIVPVCSGQLQQEFILPIDAAYGFYLLSSELAFSPSRIVDMRKPHNAPIDQPFLRKREALQDISTYQDRERIIQDIQDQIQSLNRSQQVLGKQLERQLKGLFNFRFDRQSDRILNRNERDLIELRDNYNRQLRAQEVRRDAQFDNSQYQPFLSASPSDTATAPKSPRDRVEQLRARFAQRRDSGYVLFNPLPQRLRDSLNQREVGNLPFADFQQQMLVRVQAILFEEVLAEIKQRSINTALSRVGQQLPENEQHILNENPGSFESQLQNLALPISPPDTSTLLPIAYWQYPAAEKLEERLRPNVRQSMRNALSGPLQAYYATALRYRIKETRRQSIDQSLTVQINQQIATEETLVPGAAFVEPDTISRDSIPQEASTSLSLQPVGREQSIVLDLIQFLPNTNVYLPEAVPDLQRIVQFLESHPDLGVYLKVHCHTELSHVYALELSGQRAQALRLYLEQAGIALDRISTRGMGKKYPVQTGYSYEAKVANQRTEVTFFAKPG
jgi:outer membrane protein OmpA-like peptidoglycan-associated protein